MEAVFGRDASSVFPNMNKDDDPMEALKASIGAKRFVSEMEVRVEWHDSSSHEGRQAGSQAASYRPWHSLTVLSATVAVCSWRRSRRRVGCLWTTALLLLTGRWQRFWLSARRPSRTRLTTSGSR